MNRKFFRLFLCFCLCFSLHAFILLQGEENYDQSFLLKRKKYYVSACAIFRDEARFLKEWIEFHRLQGIEHFYLINNLSSDDYQTVLDPYIKNNIVELYQWNYETTEPGRWSPIQTSAYQMIINKSKGETEWLAIIDTDEFLFSIKYANLKQFLEKYEKFSGVCVNWQMFGTSGVERIESNELLIDSLTLRAPKNYSENLHVKSIVKPSHVKSCLSPHFCYFLDGYHQVNEEMVQFEGAISPYVAVDKVRINHYWARDEDFFYQVKIPRREGWNEGADDCIRRNENLNKEFDSEILRFSKALRNRIFK